MAAATTGSSANAQLLYSFEPGLEGWTATGFAGSDLISVSQATQGFTDGTHSMAVERGRAIGSIDPRSWDVYIESAVAPQFAMFQAAAADPESYAIDFDVTLTANSFAGGVVSGPTFLISAAVNSSAAGENNFNQLLDIIPDGEADANLIGAGDVPELGTHHYSIPLASSPGSSGLYLVPNSTYYQFTLGSTLTNALFQNGTGGRGAIYYVDNVRIRELPETVEETLFSWETPDNPGTPAVNEQFEGWFPGNFANNPPHVHSITSTGATHGSSALQIDRTTYEAGFTWGSLFVLNSDTNPDPEVEQIDPVIQARIDHLVDSIMGAQSVAFDLTYMYTDQFPAPAPTFTKFGIHFTDETGVFYQAEQQGFISIPSGTPETTVTVEIPLSLFTAYPTGEPLLENGFLEGTNSLRIGLSTNTDGAQIYQIDNFRLISLASEGLPGDYNDDGKVDAADYVVWRKNHGTSNTLPNDPHGGTIGTDQYNTWRANFGSMAGGASLSQAAVPEPASLTLLILVAAAACLKRQPRS
ncbi:MAG: hypothetical protein WD738_10005 [Pirellulales bacterium]